MYKTSRAYKAFSIINVGFIALVAIVTIFPYLNVLATAFNDGKDTMMGGITIYPRRPTFENIRIIITDAQITWSAVLSVIRVVSGTLLALIVQFSAAYAFTKKGLRWRNGLLLFLTIPMFFSGGLIPYYLLLSNIHLLNNFLVYIVPCAFSFYNMIVIRTFLYTLPGSLEESAKLDGANEVVILLKIVVPLSLPILATIMLWTAVYHWNDWTTTLYFITKQKFFTLQYILMQIIRESERISSMIETAIRNNQNMENIETATTPTSIKAAQIVVTTIPIIMVYPFLQKYFIKGVMIGAIKD